MQLGVWAAVAFVLTWTSLFKPLDLDVSRIAERSPGGHPEQNVGVSRRHAVGGSTARPEGRAVVATLARFRTALAEAAAPDVDDVGVHRPDVLERICDQRQEEAVTSGSHSAGRNS